MISNTGMLHRLLFPSMLWRMPGPKVFLTFDDGPHPEVTPRVLDTLSRHGIKATFFLSGRNIPGNEHLVTRLHTEGHGIALHAYNHSRLRAFSRRMITEEIVRSQELVHSIIGTSPRLYRPPHGFFTGNMIRVAREHGLVLVMWSCLAGDFTPLSDAIIVKNTLSKLSGGSILVFHDNDLTQHRIVRLLDLVIPAIKERGHHFGVIR